MTAPAGAQRRRSALVRGSAWIVVGLAVQAGLGFAFWLLGSRVATSAELGRASALFTAISFINYASGLGLTVALARHATARSGESDALFGWGIVATVASSFVGGSLYLAFAHTPATALVDGSARSWAVFCAYTAGMSVGLLVDVRLMAARRWGWLVGRLALTGLARLPLVVVDLGVSPDRWLYHLMLAPLALSGVLGVVLLRVIGVGSVSLRRPAALAEVTRYAGANWASTLAAQAPQYVLPLLVAQTVVASANANFFLAWTVTGLVLLVPAAVAQVLLVEGARDADAPPGEVIDPAAKVREALGVSLGLATLAFLGSLVAGPLLAAIFGDAYHVLARLLPALMAAGIPWAVTSVRLSEARIQKDQPATVLITVVLGLGILVPAFVLVPTHGTGGAAVAWVAGNGLAAVVAVAVHRRRLAPRTSAIPAPS